ncbi:TIR domain-containing protein [Haloferula sp. A504]|uniref:TIR domain-containing protein n=1 Tax=Haloferula sp. A504 TaxID=3373601 RepID=UPI0031C348A4|nr:toll/interleukin-1 receptor domain-containing protein [Verrucomicrobiaceae bacterium E54]
MDEKEDLGAVEGPRALVEVENRFLQVLLKKFQLSRKPCRREVAENADGCAECEKLASREETEKCEKCKEKAEKQKAARIARRGSCLRVAFDASTPAIHRREQKKSLTDEAKNSDQQVSDLQGSIDGVLNGTGESFLDHSSADFRFRFASGGALVVVSMGGKQFYCLNWRDVDPVGWNIANGGSDNRQELLNPDLIIGRELLEELIIVDPRPEWACRYVFECDENGQSIDRDAEAAWREWRQRFIMHKFPDELHHRTAQVPLKWLRGPDSLVVEFEGKPRPAVDDVFLNITAEDQGIEIDRIVQLRVPEEAVFCDGELLEGRLLDSPIGLFEVNRVWDQMKVKDEGKDEGRVNREFIPDFLFRGGLLREAEKLDKVVEEFREDKQDRGQLNDDDQDDYEEAEGESRQFDLCPVTRNIISRHRDVVASGGGEWMRGKPADVFITFASEDADFAHRLHEELSRRTALEIFFSERTLCDSDYGKSIDQALQSARCLIAVGRKVEHLVKGWPEYEWRSFHQDILSGNKPDAQLISVISGFDPRSLPGQLRFRESIVCPDPGSLESVFPRLLRFLPSRGA